MDGAGQRSLSFHTLSVSLFTVQSLPPAAHRRVQEPQSGPEAARPHRVDQVEAQYLHVGP